MEWSPKVEFHPWLEQDIYQEGFQVNGVRIKILLLGESHNVDNNEKRAQDPKCIFTQRSVRNYLKIRDGLRDNECWSPSPYWRRVENIFGGQGTNSIWNRAAFYNYLQEFQNAKPSDKDYEKSQDAFIEVVRKLNPDAIVVLCMRLWRRLKDMECVKDRLIGVNHPRNLKHPYEYWHKFIMDELVKIKTTANSMVSEGNNP